MVEKVRAVVTVSKENMRLKEFPYPRHLRDHEFILKVRIAGICGSDHHLYSGQLPEYPFPIIQGHEGVCEIEEIGERALLHAEANGELLHEGDRVVIFP